MEVTRVTPMNPIDCGIPKHSINLGKFHHDRTLFSRALESWLIREIIPKWPNNSGWWNMILYPDVLPLCIAMITLCKAKKSAEKSGKKVDAIPIPTDDVKFAFDYQRVALVIQNWLVVWNMNFTNSHILGIMVPTDFHIFQRGRYTTNQKMITLWESVSWQEIPHS